MAPFPDRPPAGTLGDRAREGPQTSLGSFQAASFAIQCSPTREAVPSSETEPHRLALREEPTISSSELARALSVGRRREKLDGS